MNSNLDELICEKEKFALVGDSLDCAFTDLIPNLDPFYTSRNPKPPSPTPPPLPTPPPESENLENVPIETEQPIGSTDVDDPEIMRSNDDVLLDSSSVETQPDLTKTVTPSPPPFDYMLDLPPEAAEVPFVKNFEPKTSINEEINEVTNENIQSINENIDRSDDPVATVNVTTTADAETAVTPMLDNVTASVSLDALLIEATEVSLELTSVASLIDIETEAPPLESN